MDLDDNLALVRRFWQEVWNEGKLELLDDLFDPAVAELHRAFISRTLSAFSDSQVTIEDEIAEGDRVVTRYSWRAVHTGVWDLTLSDFPMQVPPTGKAVWDRGIGIFRISEGKVVENWVEWTKLELAQQLGAIQSSKPATR
jgi:predicted ester cyclase